MGEGKRINKKECFFGCFTPREPYKPTYTILYDFNMGLYISPFFLDKLFQ